MQEKKTTWLGLRIQQVYGMNHGTYSRFIRRLEELGVEITKSNMSFYVSHGLPTTTIGSPPLLRKYADALECSVIDILNGHGFELDSTFENVNNPKGRELIRIIREYAEEDDPKLNLIYDNTISIVKY